jgi:hypothetical protein
VGSSYIERNHGFQSSSNEGRLASVREAHFRIGFVQIQ